MLLRNGSPCPSFLLGDKVPGDIPCDFIARHGTLSVYKFYYLFFVMFKVIWFEFLRKTFYQFNGCAFDMGLLDISQGYHLCSVRSRNIKVLFKPVGEPLKGIFL